LTPAVLKFIMQLSTSDRQRDIGSIEVLDIGTTAKPNPSRFSESIV